MNLKRTIFKSACLLAISLGTLAAQNNPAPTFSKDVLPILQAKCQSCHRPGQVAPMAFLTYEQTRPWAKAIKAAVATRKMPPWFADPQYGHFLNDRSLKQSEIDTIAKWADNGATEGNPKDAPPSIKWADDWFIKPDVIVDGPSFDVPAKAKNDVIEWVSITVPSGFKEDTWVTSVQIKPKYAAVAHHICLGFNPHTPNIKYFEPVWLDKNRDEEGSAIPGGRGTFGPATPNGGFFNMTEDCYLPGNPIADYRDFNAAKFIPAGSDITLNLHYTPNGTAVKDHVQIGFTITKQPPQRKYVSLFTSAPTDARRFAIPANDGNWESPPAEVTFATDVELVYMMPHMHVRGKDMSYALIYPDGKKETVLSVPRYDFNWQLGYNTSIKVPKGTKLHVEAHYDNSANNKWNPNPNKVVYYGEMTWEEMMFPFFGVVVDRDADASRILQGGAFGRP
jgi:hypothetical protein